MRSKTVHRSDNEGHVAAAKKTRVKKSAKKAKKSARCWPGYEPTPGKKSFSKGSCKPKKK